MSYQGLKRYLFFFSCAEVLLFSLLADESYFFCNDDLLYIFYFYFHFAVLQETGVNVIRTNIEDGENYTQRTVFLPLELVFSRIRWRTTFNFRLCMFYYFKAKTKLNI